MLNTTFMLLNKPENLSVFAEEVIDVHRKRAREQAVPALLRDESGMTQMDQLILPVCKMEII